MRLGEYQERARETDQNPRRRRRRLRRSGPAGGDPPAGPGRRGGVAVVGIQETAAGREDPPELPGRGRGGAGRYLVVRGQRRRQVRTGPRGGRGRKPRQSAGPVAASARPAAAVRRGSETGSAASAHVRVSGSIRSGRTAWCGSAWWKSRKGCRRATRCETTRTRTTATGSTTQCTSRSPRISAGRRSCGSCCGTGAEWSIGRPRR